MKSVNELQVLQAQAFELAAKMGPDGAEMYQIAYRLGEQIQYRLIVRRVLRHIVSEVETLFHAPAILRDFTTDELNDASVDFFEQLWQAETFSDRIQVAVAWRAEMREYVRGQ